MKRSKTFTGIIAALSVVIAGSLGFAGIRYLTTDRGLIGKTEDQLVSYGNENVNVMLNRPENWHQIAVKKLLTHGQFAGIDGSTATIPITAELARQFCGAVDQTDSTFPLETNVSSYLCHNKTDAAYDNLIGRKQNRISWYQNIQYSGYEPVFREETVRLIFATPPSADELQTAEQTGVVLEADPVALDGFVFITHKDNPVDSLTVQQIRDIYTGKITNWKDVGGKNEKIRAFQRTKNSGSQTAMEELVMQGKPMKEAPVAFIAEDMGSLVELVAEYENETAAIGYTYYYYINNLYKNPDIKVIKIDGISPENENLVSGAYPFTASYDVVIRGDEPADSVYRNLRDYMLSDEGQEIIRLAGYCPVKG